MEALLLVILFPFIIMLSLADGSSLTRDIELIFYYTDSIDTVSTTAVSEETVSSPVRPSVSAKPIDEEDYSQNHQKAGQGINSPKISSNTINDIKGRSDNLGKDPHSMYKY